MKIPYVNLKKQWQLEKKDILKLIDKTLSDGEWVGGSEIEKFETNIKKICKTKYAVALNSGTDALTLGMYLLDIKKGDEVITTPNSFIASVATIVHLGAKPVFVDVLPDQNIDPQKIKDKITKKTKAIMPVHLTGRVSDMDEIIGIAKKYNLKIIEDAAQSIGARYKDKPAGSFGDVGCFSAHPLKNLNAIGDSGYLVTNNEKISSRAKDLRNHGMSNRNKVNHFGHVSRMDNIQASILNYRIKNLKRIIMARRKNADFYFKNLNDKFIQLPYEKKYQFNTFHTFVIQVKSRDKLQSYLKRNNINTAIHYPIPVHLQPACKKFNYSKGDFKIAENQSKKILTLPINEHLSRKELKYISNKINKFYEKKN